MKAESLSKIKQVHGLCCKKETIPLFMNVFLVLQCWFAILKSSSPIFPTGKGCLPFLAPTTPKCFCQTKPILCYFLNICFNVGRPLKRFRVSITSSNPSK